MKSINAWCGSYLLWKENYATTIEVGILGATGMVGQHFVKFLQDIPGSTLTWVGASDRSAGKKYREATTWRLDGAMPEASPI